MEAGIECSGPPCHIAPMESTSKGALRATPVQNRRVMLRNSESSSSCAMPTMARGSKAMPQMGQVPGLSLLISGCIGQVYSTASGSRAMPHLGQAPGLLSRTSGSMGQTYVMAPVDCAVRRFLRHLVCRQCGDRLYGCDPARRYSSQLHQTGCRLGLRQPLRISLKLFFTPRAAKVKRLALILGFAARFFRLDPHPADDILDLPCRGLVGLRPSSPFHIFR